MASCDPDSQLQGRRLHGTAFPRQVCRFLSSPDYSSCLLHIYTWLSASVTQKQHSQIMRNMNLHSLPLTALRVAAFQCAV